MAKAQTNLPALDALKAVRGRIDELDKEIEALQRQREEVQAQPRTLGETQRAIRDAGHELQAALARDFFSPPVIDGDGGIVRGAGKGHEWISSLRRPGGKVRRLRELVTRRQVGGGITLDEGALLALLGDVLVERLCGRAEIMFKDAPGLREEERSKRIGDLDLNIAELDLEREGLLTQLEDFGLAVTKVVTR